MSSLSVILPYYNHKKYLEEFFQSLFSQSRLPDECVIVNDGSTDGSGEILEKYREKHPQIRLIHLEKNQGAHAATNLGILAATGEYLNLRATDDLLLPDFFRKAMKAVKDNPEIGVCFGDFSTFEESAPPYKLFFHRVLNEKKSRLLSPEETVIRLRKDSTHICSSAAIFRRELIVQYGMYDPQLKSLSDYYLTHQIALRHPIFYIPHSFAALRIVKNSYGQSIRFNWKKRKEMVLSLLHKIDLTEDLSFQKSLHRSRMLSFGGYFLLLILLIYPQYWKRLIYLIGPVFKQKMKSWGLCHLKSSR